MTLSIKKIPSEETIPVRHAVLRQGKPVSSCIFDGDNDPKTIHFGYFKEKTLVGVLSLYQNSTENIHLLNPEKHFQIRGMAVLTEFQKQGIGELLVIFAENHILSDQREKTLVWFNARENAVGFYEKLAYQKTGVPFEIPDVGPHYIMYKILYV